MKGPCKALLWGLRRPPTTPSISGAHYTRSGVWRQEGGHVFEATLGQQPPHERKEKITTVCEFAAVWADSSSASQPVAAPRLAAAAGSASCCAQPPPATPPRNTGIDGHMTPRIFHRLSQCQMRFILRLPRLPVMTSPSCARSPVVRQFAPGRCPH